jgi:hypothetical protein
LQHCSATNIQRRRPKTEERSSKGISIKYYVQSQHNEKFRVCKSAFLKILRVNEGRVKGILNRYKASGFSAIENRGGNHEMFADKIAHIEAFINTLKPVESHYCRSYTKRKYLNCDANIRILHKEYNKQCIENNKPDVQVKESYFRHIFNTRFNIGFESPKSDTCSKCTELKERLKLEKNEEKASGLSNELKFHRLRADSFYEFLQETKPELKTISFDCQKNQPVPKFPDQVTYYSRQLSVYNFTIVEGDSHASLKKENVHI